jgi:hypothetical protein
LSLQTRNFPHLRRFEEANSDSSHTQLPVSPFGGYRYGFETVQSAGDETKRNCVFFTIFSKFDSPASQEETRVVEIWVNADDETVQSAEKIMNFTHDDVDSENRPV